MSKQSTMANPIDPLISGPNSVFTAAPSGSQSTTPSASPFSGPSAGPSRVSSTTPSAGPIAVPSRGPSSGPSAATFASPLTTPSASSSSGRSTGHSATSLSGSALHVVDRRLDRWLVRYQDLAVHQVQLHVLGSRQIGSSKLRAEFGTRSMYLWYKSSLSEHYRTFKTDGSVFLHRF